MNEDQPRVPAGSPDGGQWAGKEVTGWRHGSADRAVTFYSKERDYAEEYATERGGSAADVKQETFRLNNPIIVEADDRQFAHPDFEKPHLERAMKEGRDAVVFRNGIDEFYARVKR